MHAEQLSKIEALKAELQHHKHIDAVYKLSLNGTYGKLGSKYSPLYNPTAMLSVTLLGQVQLLQLIRSLTADQSKSIKVLSANTDGVECIMPVGSADHARAICKAWEVATGMDLEEERVLFVARRDVNNYFMLTASGKVKTKGIFEPASVRKSPAFEIIYEAVMASFGIGRKGEIQPVNVRDYIVLAAATVEQFNKFLSVRTVNGGAVLNPRYETRDDWVQICEGVWRKASDTRTEIAKSGAPVGSVKRKSRPKPYEVFLGGTSVGRVVRWYIGVTGEYIYTPKGGRVPLTKNAVLVQDLRCKSNTPIDVEWYIGRAEKLRDALLSGGTFDDEEDEK